MERDEFFAEMRKQGVALTFLDVRLRTAHSSVPAYEVTLDSRFSRNVPLKTPIVSAAMDTVTNADMAITMAKLGGIGVIHAGMSPRDQRREVKRVKFHLNGLIKTPITVSENLTLSEILAMRDERKFKFHSFPVIDDNERLTGLVTRSDFEFSSDRSRTAGAAMTPLKNLVTAGEGTTIDEAYDIMKRHKKKVLPLIASDGRVAGLYVLTDVARIKHRSSATYNVDADQRLRVAAAVPTDEGAIERAELLDGWVDALVIDTARGDGLAALKTLRELKRRLPHIDVVVGNISEGRSARMLAEAGADGIKVGQGPGSICTTRDETGIGAPQVTAVYECARAVRGMSVPVIADGGISHPGDISIAIGAGAHAVMLGRLLAGTKEAPGDVTMHQGNLVKEYRGMGSAAAMRDSQAARRRYGDQTGQRPIPEGVESYVPYKGPVEDVMYHYVGALRKSLEYCGAASIEEHRQKATFWRITNAGARESHPHDVTVISRSSFGNDDAL